MRLLHYILISLLISCKGFYSQLIVPSFNFPGTVCVNQTFTVQNTSTGSITSQYWNFCMGNQNATPTATNLGTYGGAFSFPVYYSIAKDGSNYYAFVSNNNVGTLTRMYYGSSLLNTPTITAMGNFGVLGTNLEDIHLELEGSTWYGLAVGGTTGSIYSFTFGTTLANTPTVTNMGNIGTLGYPQRLQVFRSGGNCYAFTPNAFSHTITRFSFGSSISSVPTGTNFGNIGSLSQPDDMAIINFNGNWHAYIVNEIGNTITRLDFGTSLLNTPSAVNLGNTGALNGPRGIDVYVECGDIKGLIVNRYGNDLLRMNFTGGPTGTIVTTSFGNIANFSFPHSIERFRVGDTMFAMIPNVNNNTLSRIYYPGCSNSSIASSTLQTPPPISYNQPGTYYINLVLNETQITQASTCMPVVVVPSPSVSVLSSAVTCSSAGTASVVTYPVGPAGYTFSWAPSGLTTQQVSGLNSGINTVTITNSAGCSTSASVNVLSAVTLSSAISVSSVTCNGGMTGSASVSLSGGSGTYSFTWNGGGPNTSSISNLAAGIYTVNVYDINSPCSVTRTFQIVQPSASTLVLSSTSGTTCVNSSVVLNATMSGGTPSYVFNWIAGPASATFAVSSSTPGVRVYTMNASDNYSCAKSATIAINHIANPVISVASVSVCPNSSVSLTASGATSYTWLPMNFIGNTYSVNPASAMNLTVTGQATNGCRGTTSTSIYILPSPNLSYNTYTINCANLGSATVTASGGIGPFSYTWSPTSQNSNIATGLFPGTYTVTVKDNGTSCVYSRTVNFAPLVPLAGTVTATPSLQCNNVNTASASISLSGGSGAETYTWTGNNGSQNLTQAQNLGAGIHTVTVVDALTYCTVTKTFSIVQPLPVVINISANTPTACVGTSISFTALASGGIPAYTYTWSNGPANSQHTVPATTAGNFVYSVSATDANSCTTTNSVGASFIPNPTVTVSDVSICPSQPATLVAFGASTYTWNTSSTGNLLTVSPPVNTLYTVIGSAASCTAQASASVIIKPAPTATLISNSPVCNGDTLKLFGSGGVTYNWTGPMAFSSTVQNPVIVSAIPFNSGNYNLKVTAANGCTNAVSSFQLVNPSPHVNVWGATICETKTLNIGAGVFSGATYSWTGPSGFTSTLSNNFIVNSTPLASGIYSLQITSSAGCSTNYTVSGVVVAKPQPTIVTNSPLCVNSTLLLSASGGQQFIWSFPGGQYYNQPTVSVNNVSLQHSGNYTLQVTSGPCIIDSVFTIVVNNLPSPVITHNSPVCESTEIQISASGAASFLWTGPNNFTGSQTNVNIPNSTFLHAGTYTLTASAGLCSKTITTSIQVIDKPVISVIGDSICAGENATLSASGGVSYNWTGPNSFAANTSTIVIIKAGLVNAGNYLVIGTGTNGCTSTVPVPLVINSFTLPVPLIEIPGKICINDRFLLKGSGGVGYNWGGPNNFFSSLQSPQIIATPASAGIYTLSVTNNSNCSSSQTVNINVLKLPEGQLISSVNNRCVPFCSHLSFQTLPSNTLSAPVVSTSYEINFKTVNDTAFLHCFTSPGNHHLKVVYKDSNTCVNTATFQITAYEKPEADFLLNPLNPVAGAETVLFQNNSFGADLAQFNWFFLNTTDDTISTRDVSYLFKEPGQYPVVLITKNRWGCADTVIKNIFVKDEINLFVPDAFTPNGDGLNDIFKPKGSGISKYNFTVYNRWGQLIYSTTEFTEGWDGTFNGGDCKNDVYTWKIIYSDHSVKEKVLLGQVSLLRAPIPQPD